uniref:Copia-like retroelement pol polyprotein n=1 Tax=Arabidopsis thaliana TaxID=3702 RepID=Q9ZUF5_ARATH|nr:copia-like retroelement pol polyprotein [Arabidopsis thaliana]
MYLTTDADPAERMDYPKEFVEVGKAIILEKGNYGHWKVKMRALIRGLGKEAWIATSIGWKAPVIKGEDGEDVLKTEDQWNDAEEAKATANSRALSLIFNSVNQNQFKQIQNCESAKEAWDKLAKAYEGTSSVKRSRIDMLASQFENLTMEETENIEEFSGKISAIASEAHNLGKKYKDKKLVKKLLRCLPSRFESKRTAMGTSLDTNSIDFEEVVGMFQAYELEITSGKGGYGHIKAECPSLKRKDLKCSECKGLGHIKFDCVGSKSKPDRSCSSESESDSNDGDSEDYIKGFVSFVGIIEEKDESSDSEADGEDEDNSADEDSDIEKDVKINEEFRKLYDSWLMLSKEKVAWLEEKLKVQELTEKLKGELTAANQKNSELTQKCSVAEEKNRELSQELSDTRKKIHMLNSGTKDLDSILAAGRVGKSNFGLGYNGVGSGTKTNFVRSEAGAPTKSQTGFRSNYDAVPARRMYQNHDHYHSRRTVTGYECYYCGRHGHFRDIATAYTSIEEGIKKPWYFDSGASRHMTGSQSNLENYTSVKESKVTFGGGDKGKIKGKGDLTKAEKPQLTNVYFVEGLTANLISVSQLCDEGLTVSFNSVKCWATNEKNQNTLTGVRTGNNCYMWEEPKECLIAEKEDRVVWHQRLGHMNARSMSEIVSKEMVRGVQELKHIEKIVYDAYNQGKQIRVQHKRVVGVVERKNQTFQEMARAMIHGHGVPEKFWTEAISTVCYVINHVYVRIGGTFDKLVKAFVKTMTTEFRLSMVGELKYFLGLQINQIDEGIAISQSTYDQNLVKRFDMCSSNPVKTPMSTTNLCSCCTKFLWMKHMGLDYGMSFSDHLLVKCDNESAIAISKNPVQHSITKHIAIRHHFVRELVEEKQITVEHMPTEIQLADIFTKPLDLNMFVNLQKSLGIGEV